MDTITGRRPDITIAIDPKSIRRPGVYCVERVSSGQSTVFVNIEHPDMPVGLSIERSYCVNYVKPLLIGRKGKPIRLRSRS